MLPFAATSLPLPTVPLYRRSVAAAQLRQRVGEVYFGRIFAAIAPAEYARLTDYRPVELYKALVSHCSALFPVYDGSYILDEWEWAARHNGGDYNTSLGEVVAELWDSGIPVEVMGFSESEAMSDDRFSPMLAWAGCLTHGEVVEQWPALRPYQATLNPLYEQWMALEEKKPRYAAGSVKPPRGREWRKPWGAMRHVWDYCTHDTGSSFLDVPSYEQGDWGLENPRWHVDEIRAVARNWSFARPIFEQIQAMRAYIDAKPAERLPLMAKLVCGDPATRIALSRPKARTGKTLAEVFGDKA